jgi:hypothetical protein
MNPISHILSKSILKGLLVVVALTLIMGSAMGQSSPSLQWELVNPFRFIHDQDTVDELKDVFAGLKDKSAVGLELALQKKSEAVVRQVRDTATNCNSPSPADKRKCFAPYSGWFAKAADNNYADTCWDSVKHKYRTDAPCADYINPTSHRVRVWVVNPESLGNAVPQWTVAPQPASAPMPCDAKYSKRFCIEFNVPYESENPVEVRVSAQFPHLTLAVKPNIKVKDLLIVGLGDSFAAGEGNPDIPATFVDSDLKSGRHGDGFAGVLAGHDKNEYPQKDKEAVWLDRRCHRSMYSYQFKTALQLALANPQQAITYVSFSCSGAVTDEIINKKQKAAEGGDDLDPQLKALGDTLRSATNSPRTIDYLLLSTGGNDVGFANYVAYILLRQKLLRAAVTRLDESKIKHDFDDHNFEKLLLGAPGKIGNYVNLQRALFDPGTPAKPNLIKIRDCHADAPCARIILTPYPNILTDENNVDCQANRSEFDEFFGQNDRVSRIQLIKQFVFDQITDVQSKVPAQLHWTLVDGNVGLYRGHGFCSRNSMTLSDGEKFQVPTYLNNGWLQFNPRDYKAYEPRSRWFRLPVDSVLTTDQAHDPNGNQRHLFLEYARSNIMHPTAEGLARTAQLNFEAIRRLEGISPQ